MNSALRDISSLLRLNEELNSISDLDALLERVLTEARNLTDADAGSIYLRNDDRLSFKNVQNETLFADPALHRHLQYAHHEIPIDEHSIAGYVAKTGQALNIKDVYQMDPSLPCTFNRTFDEQNEYRTHSVLTLPLLVRGGTLTGVLQLINKRSKDRQTVPFSEQDMQFGRYFASSAAIWIDRASMTREMVLRMIQMAELRDPKETGPHVNRVGSYTVELYEGWARARGVDDAEIRKTRDNLRIAAMLHDVGKVGIADSILKKPGKLDDDERAIMQFHSIFGARLFKNRTSELDRMSAEICLGHHEKWDGSGYPGRIDDIYKEGIKMGPGLRGEEIPLFGRIVALADVYDALICRRCYKDPWPEEKVLEIIAKDSGTHFDPAVIEVFFSIQPTFRAIRERYKDAEH